MRFRSVLVLFAIVSSSFIFPIEASAQWAPNGTKLVSSVLERRVRAVPDGQSGIFVRAPSFSAGAPVLTRRTRDGYAPSGWPWSWPSLAFWIGGTAPDQAGGAYQAMVRQGPNGTDIVIHHIGPDGLVPSGWPASGRTVSQAGGSQACELASDGGGGVYAVWNRYDGNGGDLRALRLDSSGDASPGWPADGVLLSTDPDGILVSSIHSDASGLLIHGHFSTPGNLLLPESSFLARLTPAGDIPNGWAPGVKPFPFSTVVEQDQVAADGGGGVFFAWRDGVVGSLAHLLPDASVDPAWPNGGLAPHPGYSLLGDPISDGAGGCFIRFEYDSAGTVSYLVPGVLRVENDGDIAPGWPALGARLPYLGHGDQFGQLVPDDVGGVFFVWSDERDPLSSYPAHGLLRAHHLDAFGATAPGWPASGVLLASGPGKRGAFACVPDTHGGLIAAWEDSRDHVDDQSGFADAFAIGITSTGSITAGVPRNPPPSGLALRVGPVPSAGAVRLWLNMPASGPVRVHILDLAGREVRSLFDSTLPAGEKVLEWNGETDSGRSLPPGVYLARSTTPGATHVTRIVRLGTAR